MNLLQNKQFYRLAGRTTWQHDVLYLGYSASYIEFTVKGGSVSAGFLTTSYPEGEEFLAWVAVFLNGAAEPMMRFPLRKEREEILLYEAMTPEQTVTIRIMKYSEAAFSLLGIESIEVTGEVLPPPKARPFRLEFIGDSITCGYGIEGIAEKDVFTTMQENPWHAYACKVAEALQAEFELISWSGNGIISHYIEPSVEEPGNEEALIPALYPYTDMILEQRMGRKESEYTVWDTQDFHPDVVVLHLGTNDCSYTRRIPERNAVFQKAYLEFITYLHHANPHAQIICMIGAMQQELNETIEDAVIQLQAAGKQYVHYLEVPPQRPEDGLGTDYHPSQVTQDKMAELLISCIKSVSCHFVKKGCIINQATKG